MCFIIVNSPPVGAGCRASPDKAKGGDTFIDAISGCKAMTGNMRSVEPEKGKQILVVEDSPVLCIDLSRQLDKLGYGISGVVSSGEEALQMVFNSPPDLILMDIMLAGSLDGIETAEMIAAHCDIPIIYTSALSDEITFNRAKKTCPYGYIVKPFRVKDLAMIIEIAFNSHSFKKQAVEEKEKSFANLRQSMNGIIQAIALTVEARDPYTAGHQRRVSQMARLIGNALRLTSDQIEGIRLAGVIHDLGKIHIPSEILSKPGMISAPEFALIKTHPQVGYDILKTIEFPWPIAQIVYQHHERLDGSGYPLGITGDEMLIEAKIVSIADVVEAMISHRPYRPALGIETALDEIMSHRGILYDADVVEACRSVIYDDELMLVFQGTHDKAYQRSSEFTA